MSSCSRRTLHLYGLGAIYFPRNFSSSSDNCHSVRKLGRMGTWRTGGRILLVASTEYVTILFGMDRGGFGADGRAFWDLHNGEIVFFFILLDLYLLEDRLEDQRSNVTSIRKS